MASSAYSRFLADRIQSQSRQLAQRWLERLQAVLPVESIDVFPSATLLDHIPAVLEEIGRALDTPDEEDIAANTAVIEKARELGLLRHEQKASVHQLLREYEILGDVLHAFVEEETRTSPVPHEPVESVQMMGRLNHAVHVLMRTTVDTFTTEYTDTIQRQTAQLEGFNRMASHELRTPLGAIGLGLRLLRKDDVAADPERRAQVLDTLDRGVDRMRQLLQNLERLTRLRESPDLPTTQQIDLGTIVEEVVRQIEPMASARGVEIRISPDLPTALLDVARIELVLTNLLSNAIKYSDPEKPSRWVEVAADPDAGDAPDLLRLRVRDNGIGIPAAAIPTLFQRFVRGHADRDEELGNDGSGLGLSIANECVEALGGILSVESTEGQGTSFVLVLPLAGEDRASPG